MGNTLTKIWFVIFLVFSWFFFTLKQNVVWLSTRKKENNVGRYQRPIDFTKHRYCLFLSAFRCIYNSCGGCWPSKQRKTLKNFYLVGGQKLQVEISKNNKQNEIVGRGKNGTTERLGVHDQTVVGFGRDSRSLQEFPYRSTGGIFLRPNSLKKKKATIRY